MDTGEKNLEKTFQYFSVISEIFLDGGSFSFIRGWRNIIQFVNGFVCHVFLVTLITVFVEFFCGMYLSSRVYFCFSLLSDFRNTYVPLSSVFFCEVDTMKMIWNNLNSKHHQNDLITKYFTNFGMQNNYNF